MPVAIPVGRMPPSTVARMTAAWSLDILRAGLGPALDPTPSPWAGLSERNGIGMFSLEKLDVYDRALASVASLAQLSTP